MIIRRIHHLEDEPEGLRWIPGTLLNYYWLNRFHWIQNEGGYTEQEDGRVIFFLLQIGATLVQLEYRVYRARAEFEREFPTAAHEGDIVLLDVLTEDPAGGLVPDGLDVFPLAERIVGRQAVYYLSAYPQKVLNDPKVQSLLPEGHLLLKPVDANSLVKVLVNHFSFDSLQV